MRILIAHNFYQQAGGEDEVFASEVNLLKSRGHRVICYTMHNSKVTSMPRLALAQATFWNRAVYHELRALIRRERPDIAHFHNTFPLISPAAYYAAKAEGVPVVQSLHNYRLLCPSAIFYRQGAVCEDCLGRAIPWPAALHGCYRQNRPASGAVVSMLSLHRALGTWTRMVDLYFVPSDFMRQKFIQVGFAPEKLVIKPNFLDCDPGAGQSGGQYALFVGRLTQEKGLDTLLAAWEGLGAKLPLKIVGDGPLAESVAAATGRLAGVEWLGRLPLTDIFGLLQQAAFLVLPSLWYEGLPRIIIDAYATGTPVVASNLGAMSTAIRPGYTGLHFVPGDALDLRRQVEWLLAHPEALAQMRRQTRSEFETHYAAQVNYALLMDSYASLQARLKPAL